MSVEQCLYWPFIIDCVQGEKHAWDREWAFKCHYTLVWFLLTLYVKKQLFPAFATFLLSILLLNQGGLGSFFSLCHLHLAPLRQAQLSWHGRDILSTQIIYCDNMVKMEHKKIRKKSSIWMSSHCGLILQSSPSNKEHIVNWQLGSVSSFSVYLPLSN